MRTTENASVNHQDVIVEHQGAPVGRRLPSAGALLAEPERGLGWMRSALDETGAALIPDASPEEFLRLTDLVGRDFLIHPAERRDATGVHPSIQTVEHGNLALPLHCEMGYLPVAFRPGVACFYCVEPPLEGGATTLAEGTTFARRLSPSTRRLFESERLRFSHRVPLPVWQILERGLGPRTFAAGEGEVFHVEKCERDGDTTILAEYVTSAFLVRASGELAFLNSVLALLEPDQLDGTTRLSLESGSQIPRDVLAELRAIALEISAPVAWTKGDLLVVDNFRMAHGRTAFAGPRAVWARFGDDRRGHPRDVP